MVHSFYSSAQPSGENTIVANQVDALRRAGHEVQLFAADTDDLVGETLYRLRSGLRVATGLGRNPLQAINDFAPNVVHVHNVFPNFGRRWAEGLRAPLVHTLHNYRPMCANGLLFRDGHPCTRCPDGDRLAGLRFGCYRDSRLATLPLTVGGLRGAARDPLIRRANRLIVLSPLQRALYSSAGVPADRMTLSPNHLPDALDPGPRLEPGSDFVGVGRLTPEKGFADLAEVWPHDRSLAIFGEGPERQVIEDLHHPTIALRGLTPRGEVLHEVRHARALVFPSRWYEPFGLTAIEALACGTPVIAARGNSVAELLDQLGGGVTTDWDAWSETVRSFGTDVGTRQRARHVFDANFSERAFVERTEQLYADVVARSSAHD